jgi:hypothetical protein
MMIATAKQGHKSWYIYVGRTCAMTWCCIPYKTQIFRAGFISGMTFPLLPEVTE